MAIEIQIRRDTASNWTTVNPTLAQGELALETNTKSLKIGDGTTAWTGLSYFSSSGGGSSYLPLAGGTMTGAITFGTGGQYVSKGTFDTSRGGSSGISLVCAVGFEFNWQAGWLRTTNDNSTTPRPLYLDSGAGTSLKAWNAGDNKGTTVSHLGITFPDGTTQTTKSSGGGGASALVDLTDVVITSPTNGQVLKYQTSTSKWINGTDATGGSGSGTAFSTGSTAPASPAQGDRWVSTNDAICYTYYGTAWVQFNT